MIKVINLFCFVSLPFYISTDIVATRHFKYGETATLKCLTDNSMNSNWTVLWTRFINGVTMTYSNNNHVYPMLKNKITITGNHFNGEYNLRISDLNESDEGRYTCSRITNERAVILYFDLKLNDSYQGQTTVGTDVNNTYPEEATKMSCMRCNFIKERLFIMGLVAVIAGLVFAVSYIVVNRHKCNLPITSNLNTDRLENIQPVESHGNTIHVYHTVDENIMSTNADRNRPDHVNVYSGSESYSELNNHTYVNAEDTTDFLDPYYSLFPRNSGCHQYTYIDTIRPDNVNVNSESEESSSESNDHIYVNTVDTTDYLHPYNSLLPRSSDCHQYEILHALVSNGKSISNSTTDSLNETATTGNI